MFRTQFGEGRSRHFLNPSNFGITVTLLRSSLGSVSCPHIHFTANVPLSLFWLIPLLITVTGTLVNFKLTRRHPLILGWLGGFVLQAWLRNPDHVGWISGHTFSGRLGADVGIAFLFFLRST